METQTLCTVTDTGTFTSPCTSGVLEGGPAA